MSSLAVLLLCIQACLIQNALGCGVGPFGVYGGGIAAIGAPFAGRYGAFSEPFGYAGYEYGLVGGCGAAYGGAGIGNCAIAGELPVGGATAVTGYVPIIGAVEYAGPVAAAGAVTIAGKCGCGCGAPGYGYGYGIY